MKEKFTVNTFFKDIKERMKNNIVLATVIASIAGIVSFNLVGSAIVKSFFSRTLTVKGLAEKNVKADFAIWDIKINKVGGDLVNVQNSLDKDIAQIKKFLLANGFEESEIENSKVSVRDKFAGYDYVQLKEANTQRKDERFIIESGVIVKSSKVDLIDKTYRKTGELVRKGITLADAYSGPAYLFKAFNSVKNEMLQEATKNALHTAEQFAKDAGDSIKGIKTANQGVFSIAPQDASQEWENERNYIMKEIRVVTTITYMLD